MALGTACGGSRPATGPTAPPAFDARTDPQLRATIRSEDRRMDDAYNAHDPERFLAVFAPDLEFFHDTGGVQHHAQIDTAIRSVFAQSPDIHREVVGDIEVYPIKDFGAVEIGAHRFCHTERGRPNCATFRFVHVWRHDAGGWQIARVVSYGH